jgi:hypothetical protein
LGDLVVETCEYPGQATTMKSLLLKLKGWNALDFGWEPDTYEEKANIIDNLYSPVYVAKADMVVAVEATPTAAEFRTICKVIIAIFNIGNATVYTNVTDADLPIAGANPTAAEIATFLNNVIAKLNNQLSDFPIANVTVPGTATGSDIRNKVWEVCRYINQTVVTRNAIPTDLNTGFVKRRDLIFNPVPNVMLDDNTGKFTFKIPLSHLFSFSEGYDKVIYNSKHELRLNRANTEDYAIFRSVFANAAKVRLDRLRWYIPVITPSNPNAELLKEKILSGIPYDVPFIGSKIDQANNLYNQTQYSFQITYEG